MLYFQLLFGLMFSNAWAEKGRHFSADNANQSPHNSLAEVVHRLAVLEDKELKNTEKITALEEEILNLNRKAMEDHQQILRLNRELQRKKKHLRKCKTIN